MPLPVESLKARFPIFTHWPALVYLDSAATSQKPDSVIRATTRFYEKENASVHRGLYELSAGATRRYEGVRTKVAALIGAPSARAIAFTKGTTESINIVAQSFLRKQLSEGDNVVVSAMEHHANLIPWQQVCRESKASLRIIPVLPNGDLALDKLDELISSRTRLLAVTHISNVLGTINPVDEIIFRAHRKNIPVLIDAAQSAGQYPLDVSVWQADFLAFSAHKMFGPMGTGVLYCSEAMSPRVGAFNFGGGSIKNVTFAETEFLDYPSNLEAGTPNVSGVVGLGAALDFVSTLDLAEVARHTRHLATAFREKAGALDYVTFVGNGEESGGIVSFLVKNIHPHDVAGFLAHSNIAVRAGHHCAQPLLDSMGVPATVRASFSIYNNQDDVNQTVAALVDLKKFWS